MSSRQLYCHSLKGCLKKIDASSTSGSGYFSFRTDLGLPTRKAKQLASIQVFCKHFTSRKVTDKYRRDMKRYLHKYTPSKYFD